MVAVVATTTDLEEEEEEEVPVCRRDRIRTLVKVDGTTACTTREADPAVRFATVLAAVVQSVVLATVTETATATETAMTTTHLLPYRGEADLPEVGTRTEAVGPRSCLLEAHRWVLAVPLRTVTTTTRPRVEATAEESLQALQVEAVRPARVRANSDRREVRRDCLADLEGCQTRQRVQRALRFQTRRAVRVEAESTRKRRAKTANGAQPVVLRPLLPKPLLDGTANATGTATNPTRPRRRNGP